jgi:hypothetical protein
MITWSDLTNGFWLLGFLFLISLVIFVLSYGAARIWFFKSTTVPAGGKTVLLAGLLSGLPLGFTGMVAGFLTGSSRAPAVSASVPAILKFIGLIVVYLIGRGRLRAIIAGFAVCVFSADLLVGAVLGTSSRDRYEEIAGSIGGLPPAEPTPCPQTLNAQEP